MRPGETLSLSVTLPNEQRIEIPEAIVRRCPPLLQPEHDQLTAVKALRPQVFTLEAS